MEVNEHRKHHSMYQETKRQMQTPNARDKSHNAPLKSGPYPKFTWAYPKSILNLLKSILSLPKFNQVFFCRSR